MKRAFATTREMRGRGDTVEALAIMMRRDGRLIVLHYDAIGGHPKRVEDIAAEDQRRGTGKTIFVSDKYYKLGRHDLRYKHRWSDIYKEEFRIEADSNITAFTSMKGEEVL